MRVVITGWGGYLGPVVVRRLREAGHYVIGIDTGWYLGQWAEPGAYPHETHFADIRGFGTLAADAWVHMAGLSNDPLSLINPALTDKINRLGTLGLVRANRSAYHLVVSSCSVYGQSRGVLSTEESPVRPLTPYARAKADVDASVGRYAARWAALRLGTVFGWSPGFRLDLVVNAFVKEAATRQIVEPQSNAWRPLTHVEDVADAIVFALAHELQGIHNVVGENRRVRELARMVAKQTGASMAIRPDATDARDYKASGAKLAAAGWVPQHSIGDTIRPLAERIPTLPDREYRRLQTISRLMETRWLDRALLHPDGSPLIPADTRGLPREGAGLPQVPAYAR